MTITVRPTDTEYLKIRQEEWGLEWDIQFPEMISAGGAVVKHFSTLEPVWQQAGEQDWWYQWQADQGYVKQKQPTVYKDERGKPIYGLVTGLALRARIAAEETAVSLTLALTNVGSGRMAMVSCEGGCFRPAKNNQEFGGMDYAVRSYVCRSGKMVSMADLDRSLPGRCAYWFDPAGYERPIERKCEDFWGRSKDRIDRPALVGMVSRDGSKAVVLGYEGSESALGGKSCLHSRPEFGDIEPGSTVRRKGRILFGDEIQGLAGRWLQVGAL